ncbi:hypothetical protein CNECB9_1950031 [Cupriavidus necator]|uniref:Uncharacterized protein n=1 Tax=Cupriavidus necator TaxID=106590 RepID=A0A1K0ICV2_CUPNE|nr:hypothetical protein CNECB9_1950031 [Cupriavidus necator]
MTGWCPESAGHARQCRGLAGIRKYLKLKIFTIPADPRSCFVSPNA